MTKLEFEYQAGCQVTDQEYRRIELVLMNTKAIPTVEKLVRIFTNGGMEAIDVMYSLVEERGNHIDIIGELKTELSDAKKENRKLREFRDAIIKEAARCQS